MKPKLKPPGTKRLKLEYDGLLSNFAFKFNLRRYTMAELRGRMEAAERDAADSGAQVMRVEGAAAAAAAGARVSFSISFPISMISFSVSPVRMAVKTKDMSIPGNPAAPSPAATSV